MREGGRNAADCFKYADCRRDGLCGLEYADWNEVKARGVQRKPYPRPKRSVSLHTECPLCLARRLERGLFQNVLRQAVLKREARRTWNGRDGVR